MKYCPSCRSEYEDWAQLCRDCNRLLQGELPAEEEHSDGSPRLEIVGMVPTVPARRRRPAREIVGMVPIEQRRMIEVDHSGAHEITVEFTLQSGETFTVVDFIEGVSVEDGIQMLGSQLVSEMGTGKVHVFTYWQGEQFYFDAILMDEVAAFSVTSGGGEEEEQEE